MDKNELTDSNILQLPDEINEILLNTQEQCQMMDEMIRNQIKVKDEMIDKLHKELAYYKQEQADRFVDQLMKAIIKVRQDMKKRMSSEKWNEMSEEKLREEYTYSFEDLTDILQHQNVDPYESSEGDEFDAYKHQISKVEPTTDILLDKTIKKSISEGYTKGTRVLIAERVIVYQYK